MITWHLIWYSFWWCWKWYCVFQGKWYHHLSFFCLPVGNYWQGDPKAGPHRHRKLQGYSWCLPILVAKIHPRGTTKQGNIWGINMDITVQRCPKDIWIVFVSSVSSVSLLSWNLSGGHVGAIAWMPISFLRVSSALFKHILKQKNPSADVGRANFGLASLPSIGYAERKVACGTSQH